MVTRWPRSATSALTTFGAVFCLLGALPATAAAQAPTLTRAVESEPSPVERAVAELRRLLDEQRALLERQALVIAAQGRDIDALRRRLDDTASAGGPQQPPPAVHEVTSIQAVPAKPQVPTRPPDLPEGVVSAGNFPKSIGIPGTNAAFRIGGQGRMMLVHSLGPLGTDDRFVTSSIPVEGQQRSGEDRRVNYSASASRAHIDLRTEGPKTPLRTFLEADFAGDGRSFRLRHAFIQRREWLGGQTWSTFSDPEAEPIGIDFEGLKAI